MKKYVLLLLGIIISFEINAQKDGDTYIYNGINYTLFPSNGTAGVYMSIGTGGYTGDITIPDKFEYNGTVYTVTYIDYSAFRGNTHITSIRLPKYLTTIQMDLFRGCSGLTEIDIPDLVASIGDSAFEGCVSLTSARIGRSVSSIGSDVFSGCNNLSTLTFDAENCLTSGGYFPSSLKTIVFGNDVKIIPSYAFCNSTGIATVNLPNSVTVIGPYAFWGCSNLTTILLPNSLKSIGQGAFQKCAALDKITIPGSVSGIVTSAFANNPLLKEIVFSDGEEALYLYNDIFPNTPVTKIYVDRDLGWFWLDDAQTLATESPFKNMTSLKEIEFGPTVSMVSANLFQGCSGLTTLNIPSNLSLIYEKSFKNCISLTELNFEDSDIMAAVWEDAFENCPIKSIYMGRNLGHWYNPDYGYEDPDHGIFSGLRNLTSLTSLTFGPLVTQIDCRQFEGCSALSSLSLPDGIQQIGTYAFRGCSNLTDLILGEGISDIYGEAFGDCNSLQSVGCKALTPPQAEESTFSEAAYQQATLEVNKEASSLYTQILPWSKFRKIQVVEEGGSSVEKISTGSECCNDIYTLQGVCVKRNASQDEIKALLPGIYIIGGKKVSVR